MIHILLRLKKYGYLFGAVRWYGKGRITHPKAVSVPIPEEKYRVNRDILTG